MRIPMQVYFDQEIIEFYKEYARQQGKSFAGLMREILKERKTKIHEIQAGKMMKLQGKKEDAYQSFMDSIKDMRKKFKNAPYHHPELTDDELLYGK